MIVLTFSPVEFAIFVIALTTVVLYAVAVTIELDRQRRWRSRFVNSWLPADREIKSAKPE
jgi:hypothetical protein